MMEVRISVNGETIHRLHVQNMGHPVTGDMPADDDTRRYRWMSDDGRSGEVTHMRHHGAEVLTERVLAAHRACIESEAG